MRHAAILAKPVAVDAAPIAAGTPAFTSFGINPSVASLYEEMYGGIANGTVSFEGKGARLVRGRVDAETALRALGAGK